MKNENRETYEYYKKNKTARIFSKFVVNAIAPLTPLFIALSNRDLKSLKDPELWKICLQRESRIGMINGAIISNSQYIPNGENTDFSYEEERAGSWIGVDYIRRSELSKKSGIVGHGQVYGFLLEEIIHKDRDDRTPTYLLDIFDPLHIPQIETPSLDKLIQNEFVEPI